MQQNRMSSGFWAFLAALLAFNLTCSKSIYYTFTITMDAVKILVADDSAHIQELFHDIFVNKGYKVLQAYDGEEAISVYDSERPDVVMLDVMMPLLSGMDVLRHIKQESPEDALVVMMTAHGNEETAVEAMKRGADDYLTKPLSYKEVLKIVEELLEKNRIKLENIRLREKIHEAEKYLAHVVDNVNEALISTDRDGNILSFNKAAEGLWHTKSNKVINKPFPSLFKNSRQNGYVGKILEVTKEEGGYSGEFMFVREDDTAFPGYLSTSIMKGERGKKRGVVAVIRDLTDEKRLREQVIESAKLASLGKIVEGIAHEVRNPLISMGGVARRMEKSIGTDKKYGRYLTIIRDDVDRLEKMLKDIEDYVVFARQHKARFKPVNMKHLIENIFSKMMPSVENIELDMKMPEVQTIYGDEDHLKELFYNIIENAIEAMPKGGRMAVTAAVEDNYLNIVIEDTGCGIPKKKIDDIYDPFYTSKMSGIGIGLSKAYMIVEEHHGFIDVKSEEGKGTLFAVSFPLERRQEARA